MPTTCIWYSEQHTETGSGLSRCTIELQHWFCFVAIISCSTLTNHTLSSAETGCEETWSANLNIHPQLLHWSIRDTFFISASSPSATTSHTLFGKGVCGCGTNNVELAPCGAPTMMTFRHRLKEHLFRTAYEQRCKVPSRRPSS